MSLNMSAGCGAAILGAQFIASQSEKKEPHMVLSHLTVICGWTKIEVGLPPWALQWDLTSDLHYCCWV